MSSAADREVTGKDIRGRVPTYVPAQLQRIAQELHEIQLSVYNYEGPKTQQALTDKM